VSPDISGVYCSAYRKQEVLGRTTFPEVPEPNLVEINLRELTLTSFNSIKINLTEFTVAKNLVSMVTMEYKQSIPTVYQG
jgi:hypothetical protein